MVICLERGADLHVAQRMPLPLKIQVGFTFLVPAHLGSSGHRAIKLVCVFVLVKKEIEDLGPDLQNILRLSYDNAKVTIDLRRTSYLQNIPRRAQGFSLVRFTCKVVRSSETVLAK